MMSDSRSAMNGTFFFHWFISTWQSVPHLITISFSVSVFESYACYYTSNLFVKFFLPSFKMYLNYKPNLQTKIQVLKTTFFILRIRLSFHWKTFLKGITKKVDESSACRFIFNKGKQNGNAIGLRKRIVCKNSIYQYNDSKERSISFFE